MRKTYAGVLAAAMGTAVAAALTLPAVASETRNTTHTTQTTPDASATSETKQRPDSPREDFNGDGYEDLAVTATGDGSGPVAGQITVFYGGPDGISADNSVVVSGDSPGVPTSPSRFGDRVAAADLDSDGFADMVVYAPGQNSVIVFWGGEDGVKADRATTVGSEDLDVWGYFMETGDFNGDGEADLVLELGRGQHALLQGPFTRDGQWSDRQDLELTPGGTDVYNMAAGNLSGSGSDTADAADTADTAADTADDLVVFLEEDRTAQPSLYLRGGADGLQPAGELPAAANGVVGDFDGDGVGDLAYRPVPNRELGELPADPGTVKVRYGTEEGPGDHEDTFTQENEDIPGTHEEGDQFGGYLEAGDVTGDGVDDLGVGVPFEDLTSTKDTTGTTGTTDAEDKTNAGAVVLLKGSTGGLTAEGAQAFHQDLSGLPGVAEANDRFGYAQRLLDLDGDGHAELTVGASYEAIDDREETGGIWSLSGTADGLSTAGVIGIQPGDVGAHVGSMRFGGGMSNAAFARVFPQAS